MDFLQKPSAWFSKFYLRVQSKNCGRNSFLSFLFGIFSTFERKIFQTFSQKTSKSCQNYLLRVQRNNLWLELFLKFWIVSDFMQKSLAWISKFYLRAQIKNCGWTVFFVFFSEFFRFLSENFSDFWPNLQKVVKTTFFVSRGTICGLKYFFKVLSRFGFSAETFGIVLK